PSCTNNGVTSRHHSPARNSVRSRANRLRTSELTLPRTLTTNVTAASKSVIVGTRNRPPACAPQGVHRAGHGRNDDDTERKTFHGNSISQASIAPIVYRPPLACVHDKRVP